MVLPAGTELAPAVAVDPAGDRAVVAWLTAGAAPRVEYALSLGPVGHGRAQGATAWSGWVRWLSIALVAALVLAAVVLRVRARAPQGRRRARQVSSAR
jgi:hypothetical protein